MIGSGLKKLAAEYGMTVAHGMAYGTLKGYYVSMDEGAGWKRVTFATKFPDVTKKGEFLALVNSRNLQKEFRVQRLEAPDQAIVVQFLDNPGTMKCITSFLDWFVPLLSQYGATDAGKCPYCGMEVVGSMGWKRIGVIAAPFHSTCATRLEGELNAGLDQDELAESGSYATGFVGALIGGLLGAIIWGALLNAGYLAAIVGFVIGWLAEKGYSLLRGKKGPGKIAILVVVILLSVLAGTLLGYVLSLVGGGWLWEDIPYVLTVLLQDTEFLAASLKDVGMGLFFAALGVYSLLRRTKQEVARVKVEELN